MGTGDRDPGSRDRTNGQGPLHPMTWLSTKRARATSSMAESGQALVEAALVLPLMLMLVLGVVAVGIVGHTDAALLAVAQEAARAAATASDPGAAATHGVARGMQVADG